KKARCFNLVGQLSAPQQKPGLTFRYVKIYLDVSSENEETTHMRFGYEGRHELGYEGHPERRFGGRKHGKFGHGHRRHFGSSWMDDREGGRRRLFDSAELR